MPKLNPDAVAHAEACDGSPVIRGTHGEWSAECHMGEQCATGGWEVTGCESRAEAGAVFYGHDPREN